MSFAGILVVYPKIVDTDSVHPKSQQERQFLRAYSVSNFLSSSSKCLNLLAGGLGIDNLFSATSGCYIWVLHSPSRMTI